MQQGRTGSVYPPVGYRPLFVKVGIGAEKKSRVISEKEKKITAYHEVRPCNFIPCAAGCRTGPYRIHHPDR
ncbi:MAG: hypothetical protein ACLUD2_01775 [Clostridium sp.]